ncbi:MAG TPA: CusA/CzcA family heavy metal efflux RND transporter [Vicinamibacterales bacterium]|nr:CusA/CzcA family heavy metal efflux RND transporter [Vicinamibacterales bacterium]
MLRRVIDLSLGNRAIVLIAAAGLTAWGAWALLRTPVDAIPDLSDNQVIVFTDWPGRSPQEVEDQITYPLTTSLQGLAGVRVVRSQSAFAYSMIYVIFRDEIDPYFARARVLERLTLAARQLPPGVTPTLGPDATGVGHVFWYTLESDRLSLRELRTVQDWFVRTQLISVPGVAEVAGVGGYVEQYQVDVDPDRLRQYGLSLLDVLRAVSESNANVGGNVIENAGAWTMVRGIGLLESTEDLERIGLRTSMSTPVLLRDVASVHIGNAFRMSSLIKGDHEAVGGVVVARSGANAREVIDGVKKQIDAIGPALPDGVRIVPFYDRSQLIARAIDTLRLTLIEEILLVTLAHIVFLRHFRSILAVTLPLPIAVLVAFLGMRYGGISSNIMSLAGIAIAVGVLVDAAIVVTENAFRTIEQRGVDPRDGTAVRRAVRDAAQLVARPVVFSLVIILCAFLPVLTLTGQEGKLFRPLAWTKTFSVFGATALAVTLVPVLCTFLLKGRVHREEDNVVMRLLRRAYSPALRFALGRPLAVLSAAVLLFAGSVALVTRVGSEFMPPLNEGDLLFMPIADPSISLQGNTEIAKRQNAALLRIPEIASAVAKVARADTSTDPAPLNMTETIVSLKPSAEWRGGVTLASLKAEMAKAVQYPGVTSIWTMPIVNRIDMLTTGIRSELGLKVYGRDLPSLEGLARQIADVLRTVPGAASVYPEQLSGAQYLNITVDRDAAARLGLSVSDVQRVVDSAIGETTTTTIIDGRRRVPVRVRYASAFRDSPEAIGQALVSTSTGAVPLSAVAHIERATGPAMIPAENGSLVVTVLVNVTGRDLGGFVADASARLAQKVSMPAGSFMVWSGQYEGQARARTRLMVVLPFAVGVIFILLYFAYRSWIEAAHVLLAVPFALTGGMYLLWLSGYNFSVAVWVGFIALFGTAVQTAMLMVFYLDDAVGRARERLGGRLTDRDLRDAVMEGALLRLRPKIMTTSTVVLSLVPIFWTSRVGSEVLKPLATPVLGGMVSSLLHVLIITPVIFYALRRREVAQSSAADVAVLPESDERRPRRRTWVLVAIGLSLTIAVASLWVLRRGAPADVGVEPGSMSLATVEAGDLRIIALGPPGTPRVGRSRVVLEFRDRSSNALVDVGTVSLSGAMSMPGMAMTSALDARALAPGRYEVEGEYRMAGAWQFTLTWQGPHGAGRTALQLEVH